MVFNDYVHGRGGAIMKRDPGDKYNQHMPHRAGVAAGEPRCGERKTRDGISICKNRVRKDILFPRSRGRVERMTRVLNDDLRGLLALNEVFGEKW